MFAMTRQRSLITIIVAFAFAALLAFAAFSPAANANHSWNGYHWGRTSNPFTLKLGNNLSSTWKPYLQTTAGSQDSTYVQKYNDWNRPLALYAGYTDILNPSIVQGQATTKKCRPTSGRVEVCNSTYGYNGWLGVASIWTSGDHIVQGTVKLNDTYFNSAKYNKPAWRNMVMCQEVGHTFGLDHQDETFDNTNLGTCMDYTNDPTGTAGTNGKLDNEAPNQHDYDELATIYKDTDSSNTYNTSAASSLPAEMNRMDPGNASERGRLVRKVGRYELYERDFGKDNSGKERKVITWVIRSDAGSPATKTTDPKGGSTTA